ncbi:MAG: GIY-YIG nuclease family protein, partial [Bacteroidota bacterium]|nr:GIY-YIG nuclease family protein [Bacteroidota bacterium]
LLPATFIKTVEMFYVYLLYSLKFRKTYIGYTSDLQNRLLSHNLPSKKGFTVKYRPWEIIYQESFVLKLEAMEREKFLKSGKGREFLANIVSRYLNSNPPEA